MTISDQKAFDSILSMAQNMLRLAAERAQTPVTPEMIEKELKKLAIMMEEDFALIDRDALVDELIRRSSRTVGENATLSSGDDHIAWLDAERKKGWTYWQRYSEYMEVRIPWTALDALDIATDDVLSELEDPTRDGAWDRRGLVVGHVQSGNRPFHRELEKLANETWCPDGATRWFYERAAGAYNVMLLREGTTPAKRRNLKEMISPKRKLTKNDIAKYHEAWRGKPNQVAMAGEKNFAAFMAALDDDPTIVPSPLDARWYRAMIAKVILFKAIESMIKTKESKEIFRQGWVNIATYVVSVVGDRLGDRLDLEQIWMRQGISGGLRDLLWDWAVIVNAEFNRIAPGQQISEVAKRSETWSKIRAANFRSASTGVLEVKAVTS